MFAPMLVKVVCPQLLIWLTSWGSEGWRDTPMQRFYLACFASTGKLAPIHGAYRDSGSNDSSGARHQCKTDLAASPVGCILHACVGRASLRTIFMPHGAPRRHGNYSHSNYPGRDAGHLASLPG
jgi:hypothetical protein